MKKTLLLSLLTVFPLVSSAFTTDDYYKWAYRFDDVETGTAFQVLAENGDVLSDASATVELKDGSTTDKVLHVITGSVPGFVLFDNPNGMKANMVIRKYPVIAIDIMPVNETASSSKFSVYFGTGSKYQAYKDSENVPYAAGVWSEKKFSPLELRQSTMNTQMKLGLAAAGADYYIDNICFLISDDAFKKAEEAREKAYQDSIFQAELAKRNEIMAQEKEAAERLFPEINKTIDNYVACDFEDYAIGTVLSVYKDGKSSETVAGATATVEKDPRNSSNKVLHIVSSAPGYVEFEDPDGMKVTNLLKKYSTFSVRLMFASGTALNETSKFAIKWNDSPAYNAVPKTKISDYGKWYGESLPLKLERASLTTSFRIGFVADGADYYIDDLTFVGTTYDPTFADKTKTIRYWADKMGKNFGTCLSQWGASGLSSMAGNNYNTLVCENEMKFDATEPNRNQFSYGGGQTIVNLAKQYNMKVRGHTLTWHGQNPDWVSNFKGSRKDWEGILKNHIYNVVGHWKGQIAEWDVVNECLEENVGRAVGDGYQTRTWSVWYQGFGDDSYIDSAFVWAHQADPDAKLYINDYNIGHWGGGHYENGKTHAMYNLAKRLKDAGIPIDGVGMQMHTSVSGLQPAQIEETVKQFRDIGLNCIITEMDMPGGETGKQGDKTVCTRPISESELKTQAEKYAAIADIMIRYDNCPTFMVWGVNDGNSWLDGSEGTGPLLFFPDNTPHPAYIEVRKTYQRWSLLRTGVDTPQQEDDPTWIDMPQTDLDVFNLAGQKILEGVSYDQVLELPKGLYIVGGKKFMIQ
ncbi:MAG: endo-1,4-beta-xylanase [Bacteroidaceae bacterium]|nr:endo-1,4-beta-xylanase [Bacteroidaceae bacterium]